MSNIKNDESDEYYSIEEVREKLSGLDKATLIKLKKIANASTYFTNLNSEDLLQEFFYRLFSEKRSWRKTLHIFGCFKGTLRSLKDNEFRKNKKSLNFINELGNELLEKKIVNEDSVEEKLIADENKEKILKLFDDDPKATDLIIGWMEGFKKKDLLEYTELSDREYETKWRKIKRRIEKKFQRRLKK